MPFATGVAQIERQVSTGCRRMWTIFRVRKCDVKESQQQVVRVHLVDDMPFTVGELAE